LKGFILFQNFWDDYKPAFLMDNSPLKELYYALEQEYIATYLKEAGSKYVRNKHRRKDCQKK
jgi:hypothetical protein